MASDTVQQIKDRLNIVDVVSQYVQLQRAGATLKARCPFHAERSPSFTVSPERGTYHCFGCGVGGDIFSFVEAIEGLDFKGALKVLADKAGVEIVYSSGHKEEKDEKDRLFEIMETATFFYVSKFSDEAKEYLKGRGLNDATIKEFRIGWAGNEWTSLSDFLTVKKFTEKEIVEAGLAKKNDRGGLVDKFRNRIMFPIADSAGRVIAFSGRSFGPHASPEAPKYLNSPETPLYHKSRILYGFDKAKINMRKHNCAVLVEGQMDLVMSHQAGWANAVAVSGTAFTAEHSALIKRMTENLVLALDGDAAGIKAAGRAARTALQSGLNVKVAQLPAGLDPADLIVKDGKDAWSAAIRDSKDIITFLLDVLEVHAKSPDIFRRSVETVVLPFLSSVQSPIAREQYVDQIAKRLRVSSDAVLRSFAKVPVPTVEKQVDALPHVPKLQKINREKLAFAFLLWLRSQPKSPIDVTVYESKLTEAIGTEGMHELHGMPEGELETLRFAAERLHGNDTSLAASADALLKELLRDRLADELTSASRLLEEAEARGEEAEIERLMNHSQVLTTRIAQLHEGV